jgi:sarcosine oxidase
VGYRPAEYDHAVIGAGAMGTSVAYYLSVHPGRTLVLERYFENHPFGSSHGLTRILRTAYAEGSVFVPLVLRARTLWKRLGRDTGQEIFRPTGVLLGGRAGSSALAEAQKSARSYGLPHELLDGAHAAGQFPAFRFGGDDEALWDPGAGILFPERAIHAFRQGAYRRGVRFRWNSPVVRWKERADGRVLVGTRQREYLANQVVLSVGAWLPSLVPELHLPLRVEQQTMYWFLARGPSRATYREMPAFVWYGPGDGYFYGTPDVGDGVKIGGSDGQRIRNPARRPRTSSRELRAVQRFLSDRLPGLPARPVQRVRCLYTNTPNKNFLVDVHPESPHVLLVSACSGHGFKFASAVGALVSQGVVSGELPPLLAPFRLSTISGARVPR